MGDGSVFEHKEPETLALEAPKSESAAEPDVHTVVVDGNPETWPRIRE